MWILVAIIALALTGCVEGATTKPLTPTEVQVIVQVISKRLIAPELKDAATKAKVIAGLEAAKKALESTAPGDVLGQLGQFLGPENQDIADLIVVLVKERVDLTKVPEMQGKAYVFAVLDGVQGGLK